MPEYKPLTQAEKQEIINRHHFLVDKMNEALGGALQYEDEAILRKLEDPKEVAVYRMYQENVAREAQRQTILESLETKYGPNTIQNNPLSRTFKFYLKLSNDPKDIEYNEKLYQDYITNPDKIVYREYSKLLDINPQTFIDMGDDKQAMAEFYMENTLLVEAAYSISSATGGDAAKANGAFKQALASMKKPIENLNELGNVVKRGGIDSLAMPTLTMEQAPMALMARDLFQGNPYPELTEVMNGKMAELTGTVDTPYGYFKKFQDYGLNVNDPDFLVKYKAIKTDPETGERTEVSFDDLFKKDDPNVRIEKRTKDEMFQIRSVTTVFQEKYAERFQSRVASRLNQAIFDANQIEKDHQGGWLERNIFFSTSPEWTAFMDAFKNFNDPKHPDYLRKDILKPKAQAYRDHQTAKGYRSLAEMKGTSLKRGTLAQTVIDVCDDLDRQEAQIKEDIDIEINTGLNGKVGFIINAKEVDIFDDYMDNVPDEEPVKEQAIEKDNDLIVDNGDPTI